MSVDEMLAREELERVERNEGGAARAIEEARGHINSARAIAGQDRHGAYQLAYDAARKAVAAHMRWSGVRVRRGEGAHVLTARYARYALGGDLGERLDGVREKPNKAEYGTTFVRPEDVDHAIAVAEALVAAVEGSLA